MSRKSKRRSPKAQINAKVNELGWLNEIGKDDAAKGETGQHDPSPDATDHNQAEASVQLVVKIPQYLYDYLQQKNVDLTHVFQQSLTTAIILAQNQLSIDELKIEIVKGSSD